MSSEKQQEQASLYVAGALTAQEQSRFERELRRKPDLRELVRSLQRAAEGLALALPACVPPRELREKVLRTVEARSELKTQNPKLKTESGFAFHGADDTRGWKELPVRGAWIKLLSLDRERGHAVLLGRLEAGVRYPAHRHAGFEDLYLLSGDLHIGDRALGPGDFHHSDAGTAHGVNHSVAGCTLLAVLGLEHDLVKFALD
jgi:quercetin dioxygenase-like cupin family protein